jgi:hypothetical protein
MKLNTDISYCKNPNIYSICNECKRNVTIYDKDDKENVIWKSVFYHKYGNCSGFLEIDKEEI